MIIIGLTGGLASGKSEILKFIKKQKIPTHDSDKVVRSLYNNSSKEFVKYLKTIGLKKAIKTKKINKKIIRKEVLNSKTKLKKIEEFIHKKVKKSRDSFIESNKKNKKKLVVLDIPLLFENKLDKICNYTLLAHSPIKIRIQRALKRKNTNLNIIKKLIDLQISDKIKIKKSDFIINTSKKKSYACKQIKEIIKKIKKSNNL